MDYDVCMVIFSVSVLDCCGGFPLIYLINGLTLDTPFVQDECIYMRLGVFFLPLFGLPVLFVLLFGAFVSPHFDFCVS